MELLSRCGPAKHSSSDGSIAIVTRTLSSSAECSPVLLNKCAWTFNGLETLGQTSWLILGNWSNSAYDNGQTGYVRGGCINGN